MPETTVILDLSRQPQLPADHKTLREVALKLENARPCAPHFFLEATMKRFLFAAVLLVGCSHLVPKPTKGTTGPVEVVARVFDYHTTIKSSGGQREIWYNAYQKMEETSVVDIAYHCWDWGNFFDVSGMSKCSIDTISVVQPSVSKQKKSEATKILEDAGYYDIILTESEDGNMAYAKHIKANKCGWSFLAKKVGAEWYTTGLLCDGKVMVTQ